MIKSLIGIILIGFFSLWVIIMNQGSLKNSTLNVAFPSIDGVDSYEPTRIHFAYEYIFLESIYSPLIELSDDKGVPVSSLAKEYYWQGNNLHFVIREDLKTIDGYPITVDDVIFSLKRLLILSENTHGHFKNLICPDIDLKAIEEDCLRIQKEGNTLILRFRIKWDFVIPMLASIDFAIIPQRSVDPKTLKIIDYRNTSGPYYVDRDKGDGHILLKSNSGHFHFSKGMAKEVNLIPTKGMNRNKIIDLFNQGEIDHITTIEGLNVDEFKNIDKKRGQFHETIHIKTEVAYITDKGKKRLSVEKRLAFAKSLQKSFHEYYSEKEGYRPSKQFFLPFGEGSFSRDDELSFEKTIQTIDMDKSGEGISLGIFKSKAQGLDEYIKVAKTYMPNLKADKAKGMPVFTKLQDAETPDYLIVTTDSGFLEDISLLSYTMNAGIFGFSKEDGKRWIEDYMNTQDRKERLKKLKKMHLESLTKGWMIPLASTPYVAVSGKPWKPHLSELFSNNPLWKIRKN